MNTDITSSLQLIVGLGNPGKEYANHRHNAGFMCIDMLSHRWNIPVVDRKKHVVIGKGQVGSQTLILAKPRTFMNDSGQAIRYLLDRFHMIPRDMLIIYDDMSLPLGVVRFRRRGSSAGHRGIDSIISTLSSNVFPRLRIGIDRPDHGSKSVEYVLAPFNSTELGPLEDTVNRVGDAMDCVVNYGINTAMNKFN